MVARNTDTLGCPGRPALSDFLLGRMRPDSLDAVGLHLSECRVCRTMLDDLMRQTDPFVETLRERAAADRYRSERPLAIALASIRAKSPAHRVKEIPLDSPASEHEQIHEYRLLARLGQGGMGIVYKALHVRLRKVVAIKVLPAGNPSSAESVDRFAREMEIIGRFDHANIVCAHDAGEWQGRHFLVMEYVPGPDVHRLVAQAGPLPVAESCEIARQAALGLAHAHRHGIVHRDVKPGNLVISRCGQVKLLDLGLALRRAERLTSEELTAAGQLMGTLDYLAPEQASDSHGVDAGADIYSLGCTLYKLLVGKPPFASERFSSPASKIAAHDHEVPVPLHELRSDVPEPLAKLVNEMLVKNPHERPRNADEVAVRLQPFCRGADLELLVADAGLFDDEPESLADAGAISQLVAAWNQPSGMRELVKDDRIETARSPAYHRWKLAALSLAASLAVAAVVAVGIYSAGGPGQRRIIAPGPPRENLSGTRVDKYGEPLPAGAKMRLGSIRLRHGDNVLSVAFSPDGTSLASGSADCTVRLWDPATGREKWARDVYHRAHQVTFSPDGKMIAVALGSGHIRCLDMRSEIVWSVLAHPARVNTVAFSPSGEFIASASADGEINVWNYGVREPIVAIPAHEEAVNRIVFSANGKQIASAGADGLVKLWNWKEAELAGEYAGHDDQVTCVAFSPDGKQIAAGGSDRNVIVWDIETGEPDGKWAAHDAPVRSLVFSKRDQALITVGDDGHIFGWSSPYPQQLFAIPAHDATIREVALSHDEKTMATAGCLKRGGPSGGDGICDHTIRLWDAQQHRRIVLSAAMSRPLTGLAATRDGRTLVTAMQDRTVVVWDLSTGKERFRIERPVDATVRVAISSDDSLLAIGGDWIVPIYRLSDGALVQELRRDGFGRIHALSFVNGTNSLLVGAEIDTHSVLYAWDRERGETRVSREFHDDFIWQIAVSPDERYVATASWDSTIGVWDAVTLKLIFKGRAHGDFVRSIAFSRDGRWLASTSEDETVCLWDVLEKKLVRKLEVDYSAPTLQFAHDGRTLILGDYGGRIRFWDMVTGRIYAQILPRPGVKISDLVVSHDGKTLFSGCSDSAVLVWDLAPHLQKCLPRPSPPAPSEPRYIPTSQEP